MNHRTNHSPKDKRTARRNLSHAVPSPRVNKEKATSTSGSHKSNQRGTATVPAPVEKDTSVQAIEEVAWKKHKLPKTLEEAMQMNRASVLLLSVPESDTEYRLDNDKPSITTEDQAEQDSLLDCSITSIHIAEGRPRPKQRVVLSEQDIDLAFDTEKELNLNVIHDGSATSDEASDDHIVSPQYGSIPFHLPAQADRGEVSVVFEKPFIDTQYVITANASIPGVMVSVTQRQRYSAVLTVERIHSGPLCEGLVLWIAMGQ
ncbi:WIAG-tail domain [Paenibacillus sp. MZ03-122A]|uniref:WIAG-tail domain n=1 Tax=Paenibacillus sp. MZ03-122A TaxID=2962033 RepID=UPI0020B6F7A5|nr:WIAG-tail domain [Paenibacillus sp. MZ03-122A]MCP3779754.1 WIAG-tail domain [Paenibacillus sp. MZ03-122A]